MTNFIANILFCCSKLDMIKNKLLCLPKTDEMK